MSENLRQKLRVPLKVKVKLFQFPISIYVAETGKPLHEE